MAHPQRLRNRAVASFGLEAAAKERQLAAGERGEEGGRGKKKTLEPNWHKGKRAPAARDKVAKATGKKRTSLGKAAAVVAAKLATLPIGSSTDPIPSSRAEGHKAVRPWRERKPGRQRAR